MKKILVLGSSGMLGHAAAIRLEELGYRVFGVSKSRKFWKTAALLDLSSKNEFEEFLRKSTFDVIVNCAALLVSQSEERKDMAVYLNSYIPRFLEARYMNTGTKIIQAGTDGVFSGKRAPYSEDSPHDSKHFYSYSKYLGEINNAKDLTVRSAFWGPDLNEASTSLFNWLLSQHDDMKGFANHVFNGVSSLEFADFLDLAIRRDIAGIYHLTAKNPISKYDFILTVKEIFGLKNKIIPVEVENIDRTLANNRNDAGYAEADYPAMLSACKEWIRNWRELYPHYQTP